jgi:hypothetical protein
MNCAASIAFIRAGSPYVVARLTAKKEIIEAGIPAESRFEFDMPLIGDLH